MGGNYVNMHFYRKKAFLCKKILVNMLIMADKQHFQPNISAFFLSIFRAIFAIYYVHDSDSDVSFLIR